MPDGSLFPEAATFHPFAEIFPLIEGAEFDALVADIKKHGLREPIIEIGNAILDGRNRYRACNAAGVKPKFKKFTGPDPLAFVLSANLLRRHLNESQRAMVAERLATMPHGGDRRSDQAENLPLVRQPDAAKMLNVSDRSVRAARVVREKGTPDLVRRVENGEVAVSIAAKVAEMPADEQAKIANEPTNILQAAAKKSRRAKREVALAEATVKASEALGTKLYGVLYVDPPWEFAPYSTETGMDRSAENHYPTMTLADIKAMTVPAAQDAVMFMWATAPLLPEALAVMAAWGFTYKSQAVWVKDHAGTGYWFRSKHELLLVGTRGDIPAPAPGEQFCSVIEAPTTRHSEKPEAFAEIIETMFPNVPAIEMFARGPRLGWDTWGNQAA